MFQAILLLVFFIPLQAKLLVSKAPDCYHLIVDADCAIYYHFSNVGYGTLENVRMNDDWAMQIGALGRIVKGSPSATFPKLHPNEHVLHSFVIQLNSLDNGAKLYELISKPAAVEYTLHGQNYTVYSSTISNNQHYKYFQQIMSNSYFTKIVVPKTHYWLVFAALVSVPTLYSLIYHWKMDSEYPMTTSKVE